MAIANDTRRNGHKTSNNKHNGNGNGKAVEPPHFASKLIASIPHGRKGKHNLIVSMILADLDRLDLDTAVLIPLERLDGERMENVRSALNRTTRQKGMFVATATDDNYFYVWRTDPKKSQAATAPDKLASR
jgi:hypothetical protein